MCCKVGDDGCRVSRVWGHGLIEVLSVERRGPFTQFPSTDSHAEAECLLCGQLSSIIRFPPSGRHVPTVPHLCR
ncbi:hypothetical protein QQF64_014947 [Cirrhinus molitorella]|uniref:Uncharacterized protein n=1 Tax=Cirrhinus molitorella TaxID=172907 RepID=A0ABR3NUC3_9TELE